MIIQVKTYTESSDPFDGTVELTDGSDIKAALAKVGFEDLAELKGQQVLFMINQQSAQLEDVLKDGDRLLVLQSMMGG